MASLGPLAALRQQLLEAGGAGLRAQGVQSLALGRWLSPQASAVRGGAAAPLQRILSLLPSLDDLRLLAVPKRKVTPHRKGKRSANKHIRFIPVVAQCSKCERVFKQHEVPSKCEQEGCPAYSLRAKPSTPPVDG